MPVKDIAIAGAGFAGAVLARELAESERFQITVFEDRAHVAGNCHTARDPATGILLHAYGPHIFNTSSEQVWKYAQRWSPFVPFTNRVKAVTAKGIFSLPINLLTINQFFNKKMNPREARAFISGFRDTQTVEPNNFEEQALNFIGRDLYENFFYGYTKKQWGVEPRDLPASIIKRLPIRFTYEDNYYSQMYQGIPVDGYTRIVERMLDHKLIHLRLNECLRPEDCDKFDHAFWSGRIDTFFSYSFGELRYRTLAFERLDDIGDAQGNPVINYCQEEIPYTRVTEHKHFAPWEDHEKTVLYREYSLPCGQKDTPYYPMRLERDKAILRKYVEAAQAQDRVTFVGRLGTYRYLDMHVVIAESLELARSCMALDGRWPSFSGQPL